MLPGVPGAFPVSLTAFPEELAVFCHLRSLVASVAHPGTHYPW